MHPRLERCCGRCQPFGAAGACDLSFGSVRLRQIDDAADGGWRAKPRQWGSSVRRCCSESDAKTLTPPEERSIGLIFQDFALFPHLTVSQNVSFGLRKLSKADRDARVTTLLKRVGMLRHMDRYPHELSGGEQQRVALARALAPRPKVMLMDEPFSGLDDRLRDDIRDETLEVLTDEGAAVLLVTHEPAEAMRMADEIALMRDGRIVQTGAPYNIYNTPVDRLAAEFFSDVNVISGVVKGALTDTAFGQFLAPGVADGTTVDICIRPQHLKLDFDRQGTGPSPTPTEGTAARGIVRRARYMGSESLVEFKMDQPCGPRDRRAVSSGSLCGLPIRP